ncbi:MAG TPA: hypothetical protein IGS52_15300 [Oscillatoriaceae cyanobacterium M33_DOE_052]|uniref:Uncharacterized protein n=1 Tax=Planktothricoides sp. SpSt-374 TaxID=2282167 RepID=A0A7C3ZJU0_9CYAN|nr:hypothetical protein [Oscillatoriaceae cyanobacterium M33_DOE_052]
MRKTPRGQLRWDSAPGGSVGSDRCIPSFWLGQPSGQPVLVSKTAARAGMTRVASEWILFHYIHNQPVLTEDGGKLFGQERRFRV